MLNSDPNDGLKRQDSADKKRAATFSTLEVLEKSALLKEFVNLFCQIRSLASLGLNLV